MIVREKLVFLMLVFGWPLSVSGQTCSCAGAPLISTQFAGERKAGQLSVGFTYEHHEISRVFTGSTRVGEETERATRSTLLELHYGLTDRLSISSTITFVQKDRTTGTDGSRNPASLSTSGLGDALLLVNYSILQQSLWKRTHLSAGGGLKAPVGASSLTRGGHPLNADMQPGTGSWDGFLSVYWSYSLLPSSTAALFAEANYRFYGANERFTDEDRYRFGNEASLSLGVGNSIGTKAAYSVAVLFRSTEQDERNDTEIFNTGGRWVMVAPSIQYSLGLRVDIRLSGRYPIAQWLRGTQPSTSYAAAISLLYTFGQTESTFTKRTED